MKITFFIGSMLTKGGAERVFANLINYFSEENDVTLLTIWNSSIAYSINDKVKVVALDKKETTIEDLNKPKSFKTKILKACQYVSRLKRYNTYLKKNNPDIVISFLEIASFISLLIKKTPVIISVRNDPKIEYKNFLTRLLMKKLYPKADGIVFQTEEAKNYFEDIIKKSEKVIIPNPVNPIFITESFKGERSKNIVSIGRIEKQKNHNLLIDAFYKLSLEKHEYTLTIYGEGSLRNELENKIKELKIENKVYLPGLVENVKEKIYKEAMFVLSSEYEGMPNALIEAMCLGMPVISTDCPCGGPAFLIKNNENGILLEKQDPFLLYEAMKKIIENREFSKKISNNACNISKKVNPQYINKRWEEFIKQIEVRNKGEKNKV